jgi:hypothetical protein
MTPKIRYAIIQIVLLILIVVLTVLVTRKFNEWFPPRTEIRVCFENSVFPGIPELRPIKDKTIYVFDKCDFTGKRWGEQNTLAEVDEAIEKLEHKGMK